MSTPQLKLIKGTGQEPGTSPANLRVCTDLAELSAAVQFGLVSETEDLIANLRRISLARLVPEAVVKNPQLYPGFGFLLAAAECTENPALTIAVFVNKIPCGTGFEERAENFLLKVRDHTSSGNQLPSQTVQELIARIARTRD